VVTLGHTVVLSLHIPGGNTGNPIAQARAQEIETMIGWGSSVDAIVWKIKSWHRRNG